MCYPYRKSTFFSDKKQNQEFALLEYITNSNQIICWKVIIHLINTNYPTIKFKSNNLNACLTIFFVFFFTVFENEMEGEDVLRCCSRKSPSFISFIKKIIIVITNKNIAKQDLSLWCSKSTLSANEKKLIERDKH